MKENISGVATTIRVPEAFLEKIKSLAAEIGDSQNGTMMNLMFMGLKVYEGTVNINFRVPRGTK